MKKTTIHCDVCGEAFKKTNFDINGSIYWYDITTFGKYFGEIPADICKKCLIKALSEEKTCNS